MFTDFIPYAIEWGIDRCVLNRIMSVNPAARYAIAKLA